MESPRPNYGWERGRQSALRRRTGFPTRRGAVFLGPEQSVPGRGRRDPGCAPEPGSARGRPESPETGPGSGRKARKPGLRPRKPPKKPARRGENPRPGAACRGGKPEKPREPGAKKPENPGRRFRRVTGLHALTRKRTHVRARAGGHAGPRAPFARAYRKPGRRGGQLRQNGV